MSEKFEERIRSAVVELVESSPEPIPVWEVLDAAPRRREILSLSSGLTRMMLVATVVLAVGLVGVWIGRGMPTSEVADVPVTDGTLGPEPEWEAYPTAREARLLPYDGSTRPDVIAERLEGEVVAAGRIDGTDLDVFTWATNDPPGGQCVQVIGHRANQTRCSSGAATDSTTQPLVIARLDEVTGEPIDVVAVWKVPDVASIIVGAVGEEVFRQRPRGGVAAFTFPADSPTVTLQAWDAQQESLDVTGFYPHRIARPDVDPTASLQGDPQDIVELPDSHPAVRLLAEGATDRQSMATAAHQQGIPDFSCAGGGMFPSWDVCMFYDDEILAVVPFDGEPGLVANVIDSNLTREVTVPLDTTQPVGIANTGQRPTLEIEYLGEQIGSTSATWGVSDQP